MASLRAFSIGVRKCLNDHSISRSYLGSQSRLLKDPSLIAIARIKLEEHLGDIPNHRDAYDLWTARAAG
jgi:hypothetical protein